MNKEENCLMTSFLINPGDPFLSFADTEHVSTNGGVING